MKTHLDYHNSGFDMNDTQPKPATGGQQLSEAYVKCDGTHPEDQIVNGQWWHPKWGCDSLQHLLDNIRGIEIHDLRDETEVS